jgi:hypothetical protein
MANLSLDGLVDQALDQAKRTLIGSSTGQLLPTFLIQFKDRPPAVIAAPWSSERDKAATCAAMRRALKLYRPSVVNYSFVSEAWVATQDHSPRAGDLLPSQRETRKECVIVTAADKAGARLKAWEIIRDGAGRVVELKAEKAAGNADRFEGRLFNLLEDE